MCITATHMIAHYSVYFDPIQKSFKNYHCNHWIVLAKIFKAIALVVVLVGMAKYCKRVLAIFA